METELSNLSLTDSWKIELSAGTEIKFTNDDNIYIVYGYNCDKSIICCFPKNINSNSIYDSCKYFSINNIANIKC